MICTLLHVDALARRKATCQYIRRRLSWPGSDFYQKLGFWERGFPPSSRDGHIAIVEDHGEVVGWARTEIWTDPADDTDWNTLEAFTAKDWRGRGIAALAGSALAAGPLLEVEELAVFRPTMMLLARRIDRHCVLFEYEDGRGWVRA